MEFSITFSARFKYRGGSGIEAHYHPDCQLQLVYGGSGSTELNGVSFPMREGDIVFVRKGSTHRYSVNENENMKTLEVKFLSLDEEMSRLLADIPFLARDQDRQIFNILFKIVLEGQRKAPHYKEMSEALLLEALLLLNRMGDTRQRISFDSSPKATSERGTTNSGVLDLVDDYIARNIHHSFTLEALADACGYNQDYLYRVIKKETGFSAIAYINRIRFERAQLMIQHTELTLTEIAWNLGFESVQYFTRFFKRHANMTPSEFSLRVRTTVRTDYA